MFREKAETRVFLFIRDRHEKVHRHGGVLFQHTVHPSKKFLLFFHYMIYIM